MVIRFFYESALWFLALIALPKVLFQMAVKGKYRSSFMQKMGAGFPDIKKGERPLIWIHAVSVGETKAVAALAKKLKNAPDAPLMLVSSASETGHADAKKTLAFADYHVYLPFDFSWIIRPILRKVRPDKVILCETDWWYNFLHGAKAVGAEVIVVNGKISDRSKERFKMLSPFTARLFSLIDLLCIQSSHYLARFQELGIVKEKMVVTGNIKFDDEHTPLNDSALDGLRKTLHIQEGDSVIVLGSSHAPEELQLLEALAPSWETHPNLRVVVVPRHPERFNEVAAQVEALGLRFHRYSSTEAPQRPPQVVLVDAMGLLRKCYQLATVAVVCGSFTNKVGGHNIIEPLYYGVPVIFGPHMHSQPELLDLVLEYRAGEQTADAGAAARLAISLLDDPERRQSLAGRGAMLVAESKGATSHTYDAINALSLKRCKKLLC